MSCIVLAIVLALIIHVIKHEAVKSLHRSPSWRKWKRYRKLVRRHHLVRGSLIYALGGLA